MDLMVRDPLSGEQNQRCYGEDQLPAFGTQLFSRERLNAPLRGGAIAQPAHSPEHVKIHQRSRQREQHHGNTDSIAVPS